jgi:hypothetical protein
MAGNITLCFVLSTDHWLYRQFQCIISIGIVAQWRNPFSYLLFNHKKYVSGRNSLPVGRNVLKRCYEITEWQNSTHDIVTKESECRYIRSSRPVENLSSNNSKLRTLLEKWHQQGLGLKGVLLFRLRKRGTIISITRTVQHWHICVKPLKRHQRLLSEGILLPHDNVPLQ